jgi:hypothetical protein
MELLTGHCYLFFLRKTGHYYLELTELLLSSTKFTTKKREKIMTRLVVQIGQQ